MSYLFLIVLSIALFSSFLILASYETSRGTRFLAGPRARLDARVARAAFIIRHVDWSAWLRDLVQSGSARLMHDVAEGTLSLVRIIERMLTRTVRYLREQRHAPEQPRVQRSFKETVLDLRKRLPYPSRSRSEAPAQPTSDE